MGKARWDWQAPEVDTNLQTRVADAAKHEVEAAYLIKDKQQRYQRLAELKEQTIAALLVENNELKC